MLKVWMNQGYRNLSHSGTWAITTVRTTSSGGSRSAAATRKTVVVEYAWFAGACTRRSCVKTARAARTANVIQLLRSWIVRGRKGTVLATAAKTTATR